MLASTLLTSLLATATILPGSVRVPYVTTDTADLSPPGVEHREVLRIGRDFGKPGFEIVVDSWVPADAPGRISDVRMWWLQNDADDRRSPFGKKVHRFVDLEYTPREADTWQVALRADRKEFVFDVELAADGEAHAYADVVAADGETIEHCRARSSRLVARRLLGIPIGIKRLEIECVDASGRSHDATLPYRKLRRGPVYRE
jgi:hypothetical protein